MWFDYTKDQEGSRLLLNFLFSSFYILYIIICLTVAIYSAKKIQQIRKAKLLNVYRVVQYALLMFLLAVSSAHMTLKFVPEYEFYNDGTANLVLFAFLSSEVVNVGCWLNFIVHMQTCADNVDNNEIKKDERYKKLFQKIKAGERLGAIILISLGCMFICWNVFMEAYSVIDLSCKKCSPFYYINEWEGIYCQNTLVLFRYTFASLVGVGFFIITVKIVFGITLLVMMKTHLYTHYYEHYYQVIVTMVWSCAIVLNRTLYNIINEYRKWDMKYNYVARHVFPDWQAPIQFLLTCFDIMCPIGVCLLNIKTINFQKYLTELMKAWQLENYCEKASIFIKVNRNYNSCSSEIKFNESLITEEMTNESEITSLINWSDREEYSSSYKSNYEIIQKIDKTIKQGGIFDILIFWFQMLQNVAFLLFIFITYRLIFKRQRQSANIANLSSYFCEKLIK